MPQKLALTQTLLCVRADVDAELPVGTRMKVPGQTGIGTYLSFKRARRGGALLPFLACVFSHLDTKIDGCHFLNVFLRSFSPENHVRGLRWNVGANEHTVAFAGGQAPARVEAISLKEFVWQVDGDKIAGYPLPEPQITCMLDDDY